MSPTTTAPGSTAADASTAADDTGSGTTADATGSDPQAICKAETCGGDEVGTWSYDILLCSEPIAIPSDFCRGGESTAYRTIEGTLELTAEGNSILHRRDVDNFATRMPKSCIAGDDCAAVYPDYECVDDGETCDCVATIYGEWIDEQTPYHVDGNSLVFDEAEGPEAIEYCARDGALALIHPEIGEWTYLVEG